MLVRRICLPVWIISVLAWLAAGVHLFKCDPAGHLQDVGRFQAETVRAEPWAMLVDHTGAVWIGTDAYRAARCTGKNT